MGNFIPFVSGHHLIALSDGRKEKRRKIRRKKVKTKKASPTATVSLHCSAPHRRQEERGQQRRFWQSSRKQ